ncbi:MAG: sugar porter family MFS transporter [Acidobacteriia bacterium]|nr:sugar porter family MFS transporter [Terriglobia bacterium]
MTPVVKTEIANSSPGFGTAYTWAISLVAALGGLLFGYDWVVIGGAKPFYEKFFHLTTASQQGWAMSCALVGCLIGALISGTFSDRYGRRKLLIAAASLFAVSSLGTAMANVFAQFVLWRISGGVAIGIASNLSPMYIAETAPAARRGRLVSVNQLTIVIGILLAQFCNWLIARPVPADATALDILNSWNGQLGWRWMFGVTAIPSLLFFIGMFMVPESPRWLAKNGLAGPAQRVLARIGGEVYAAHTLEEIESALASETAHGTVRDLLEPGLRKILLLGIVLAVFQQWCGINVIFNYAEEVFAAAGYKVSDILLNIVITGAVNLLFTLVAMSLVDKAGRRVLMLVGSAGLAIIYTLLGGGYAAGSQGVHMLLLVVSAIGCYATSLAPVTWVIISEIFPNRIRGAAMSVAVTSLWIACFILTYTFPLLNAGLGPAKTFWIYAAVCVAGFLFIKFRLPETKGKTLEEIEDLLLRH